MPANAARLLIPVSFSISRCRMSNPVSNVTFAMSPVSLQSRYRNALSRDPSLYTKQYAMAYLPERPCSAMAASSAAASASCLDVGVGGTSSSPFSLNSNAALSASCARPKGISILSSADDSADDEPPRPRCKAAGIGISAKLTEPLAVAPELPTSNASKTESAESVFVAASKLSSPDAALGRSPLRGRTKVERGREALLEAFISFW